MSEGNVDTGGQEGAEGQGGQEGQAARWSDGFSADIRDHPITQRLENPEAGIRELIGAQKLIGADKVVIPGEDATDEDRDAFFDKLGRPENVEGYELDGLERPDDLPWDDEFQTSMVASMHKLGLNQAQVQGVLGKYIERIGGQFQQANGELARSRDAADKELRDEWGSSYKAQRENATKAFRAGAGENYDEIAKIKMADGSIMGDNPALVRVFAFIGDRMSEHGLPGGSSTPRVTKSPSEAVSEQQKLYADPEFMKKYLSGSEIGHDAAVEEMTNLTKMITGGEAP